MSADDSELFAAKSRKWRWAALFAALIVFGVFAPAVGWYGQVCEEQLSAVGKAVTVCRPLGLGDLQVLAGLVVILLLLWPDLSEVSVGFVSLKRLVEETATETSEKVEAASRETEHLINAMRVELKMDMNQTMLANQHTNISFGGRDLPVEAIRGVVKYRRVPTITEPPDTVPSDEAVARTLVPRDQLIVDWALVETVLEWADNARLYPLSGGSGYSSVAPAPLLGMDIPSSLVSRTAIVVDTAANIFATELLSARSTRNLIVHQSSRTVPDDILRTLNAQMTMFLTFVRERVKDLLRDTN